MSIIDRIAERLGYTKRMAPRPPGDPIGAAAGAQQWDLPDPAIYANQARLFQTVSYIYTAVSLTANSAAAQKGGVKRRQGERLEDIGNHPMELLMLNPNPYQTGGEFWGAYFAYLLLNGNSYIWLNRANETAQPSEIWILPPSQITPHLADRLGIDHYVYDPGDGTQIRLETWEIIHVKKFHPLNMWAGMSPVEPIANIAITDIKTSRYLSKIYGDNSGRLPGVLSFRSPIDDDTWKRIKADIKNASATNNYMLLRGVGQNGVDLLNAAATVKEMEIWQGRQMTRSDIYNTFAPGLENMTSPNATEANAKTGKQTFAEFTLYPLLRLTAEKITQTLLPAYGQGLVYEYDDPRQVDQALFLADVQNYAQYHTLNEVRVEKYQSEPLADERGNLLVSQITPPAPEPAEAPESESEPTEQPEPEAPDMDEIAGIENEIAAEMLKWQAFAAKRFGQKGRSFEPRSIPPALALRIAADLADLTSADDVPDVFARYGREPGRVAFAKILGRLEL